MKHPIRQLSQAPNVAAYQPCAVDTFMSPVGLLQLHANAYGLSHLTVIGSDRTEIILAKVSADTLNQATVHIRETQAQLTDYFAGKRAEFNVKLAPKGTLFQREVWQALLNLDYGQSCCYGEIAEQIGRPKAVRAVGAANGANPIAIIVPCHRVIGKNGKLTGYAYGLEMKQQLLSLETDKHSINI
ncbi:methylated-DNA--[protein]-cysteine S-methyltransferase [Shewanella morhuae]|uniref:Methylated-DNA--protein-cysteine methyltransferase n=1 Tax=Shewanella morhuae TaxID=365591 RepID=A0A379ZK99_9GAMM|nr:methylated-DNA--[protein]-cysteine S-methyltransferase [Shewanella morhuae]SUI62738.1 Methylated-DNA--protein-cysteine methyltransferase, constitutive [Shewanella morhuae]